jgi:hypothetical protein
VAAAEITVWLAQSTGRGPSVDGFEGLLLIVGLVLVIVAAALAGVYLVTRLYTRMRRRDRQAQPRSQPLPAEHGRPWSSDR